jgi:hypothetical protein
MSFGDVLDDAMDRALLDAFDAELDLAPVGMERRVVRHLGRRQRRRRSQVGALVAITALAVIAVGVRGTVRSRAVQTEHPSAQNGSGNGQGHNAQAPAPPAHQASDNRGAASGAGPVSAHAPAGSGTGAAIGTGSRPGTDTGTGSGGGASNPTSAIPSHDLRVELHDTGLWVSTTKVIHPYRVTFVDARSVRPADVTLAVGSTSGGVATSGSPSLEEGPIGATTLQVMHAFPDTTHTQDGVAPTTIEVLAPELAAPTEPANVLTIDLHIGRWTLPYRELASDAPSVRGYSGGASPWTSVAPGTYTVVIRNPDHIGRKIRLPDGSTMSLTRNDPKKTATVMFANTPSRTYEIRPADDGFARTEHLFLWLT